MTGPFFSVIIPVYNRAASLRAAIESVRTQSCQDFEIMVVDDGSSDNPRDVVKSLGDPRIHFIAQPNAGGGKARCQERPGLAGTDNNGIVFVVHLMVIRVSPGKGECTALRAEVP